MKNIVVFSLFVLVVSTSSCSALMSTERQDVIGMSARFTKHPDSLTLETSRGTFYFLYSLEKKCLFLTTKDIFEKVREYLPVRTVQGRYVDAEGALINALTTFEKKELSQLSKRIGLQLNELKIVRLTAYSTDPGGSAIPPSSEKKQSNIDWKGI